MERQLDFFGGIAEQLSQGTPALENAYRMMIELNERTNRLSESVQRLRKEVSSLKEECHSLQIKHVGNWMIRKDIELLRAEIERLKERNPSFHDNKTSGQK